jgi:hypothetical protein
MLLNPSTLLTTSHPTIDSVYIGMLRKYQNKPQRIQTLWKYHNFYIHSHANLIPAWRARSKTSVAIVSIANSVHGDESIF